MNTSNFHYNKRLKPLARALRKDPTKAENRLWYELLSDKQFYGIRFYRQRAIGNFIADFFSKDLKLVIEVDGFTHQFEEVIEKDKKKDAAMKEFGYSVLRFEDDEVWNHLDTVFNVLEDWLEENYPHYLDREL